MDGTVTLDLVTARDLCRRAALAAGATEAAAGSIADAAVAAEASGRPTLGLGHFMDYLDAFRAGRIDGRATPELTRPVPAVILSDARGGVAHLGFDLALDDLVVTAKSLGLALFAQRNAYTCGELGWFACRVAEAGLLSLAATNSPPLMAGSGTTRPVFGTNPIALAAPQADGPPLLIDQSSSATAYVNVRRAAQEGRSIPEGWAVDDEGRPTTDPHAAMNGALLPFGGARGGNIALLVEVLTAGLCGGNWSLDAPPIGTGDACPAVSLFVLAIDPGPITPDFSERLQAQLHRLAETYGVHIPGRNKAASREKARAEGITVPSALLRRLEGGIG
ncbi:MAG: Ldh family oxidoreductase [Geminicoccaceae bacterium]